MITDEKGRRVENSLLAGPWYPSEVTRPDAGGKLYAPVKTSGVESGHTPSYDRKAIKKLCDQLNAKVTP